MKKTKILLFFIIFIILNTVKSKAVLQANGNTGATYNLSDWMLNVRKMEELGGAMGLNETLNSNLTSSSNSNNIDVHLQKNTEYGALAILSASSYGNPNKINDGETTTGNVTGAVMKFNSEWTAALLEGGLKDFSARYKNYFTENYVAKRGDAMLETKGWHGSDNSWYSYAAEGRAGIQRAIKGIFGYKMYYDGTAFGNVYSSINNPYHSRAVVVQGDEI